MRGKIRCLSKTIAVLLPLSPMVAHACATCGCTLSTDAATGYSAQTGWRVNFEYVWLDQDELRRGNDGASPQEIIDRPADPFAEESEIERDTYNRYINLAVSWHPNADWSLSLLAPFVRRDHTTYGEFAPPFQPAYVSPQNISGTRVSGLGDIKLLVGYQGFLPTRNFGVVAGLKLPTGRYGGGNEDGVLTGDPVLFNSGPLRGEALDASLQPGTGSTDAIVGAYWFQPVSQDFDAFANGQFQAAVSHRMDTPGVEFRPGNQFSLNLGLRYEAHPDWVPQLQLNLLRKSADQGALADRADSAGTVAYLSPGISVSLRRNLQAYGFVQVPVYSRLDGYQLFPRWAATLGLSMAF
ncbi:MAG: transporter [Rhodanobacteraceae bacterium]